MKPKNLKLIAKTEEDAKKAALNGYASALSGISSVIGQETAAGKSIAVASSLINTYAAITGQLNAFSKIIRSIYIYISDFKMDKD